MNVSTLTNLGLKVAPDYDAISRIAADFILAELRAKPDLLVCTATGASPTRTYAMLGEEFRRNPGLFERLRILKLDEWGGLAMDDPGSSETYLRQHLLGPLAISKDRYTGFNSEFPDRDAECARIRNWIARNGPLDICLLGLGTNGHLAMNEPAEAFSAFAHIAQLAPSTVTHSMLAQSKRKPTYGLTIGLVEIFQSRKIVLLVSGEGKSKQMGRLFNGEISTQFPASLLWLNPGVSLFCDQAAAAELPSGLRR
jgi:galactosamine-6-phosphate isomerase